MQSHEQILEGTPNQGEAYVAVTKYLLLYCDLRIAATGKTVANRSNEKAIFLS